MRRVTGLPVRGLGKREEDRMISVNDTEARRIERNVNTTGRSGNE